MAESVENETHSDSESEGVELEYIYKGKPVKIYVDLETATVLMNDPDQVQSYLERVFEEGHQDEEPDELSAPTPTRSPSNSGSTPVWNSKGKQSVADEEATVQFLKLRAQYSGMFDNKKISKNKLWNRIAEELKDHGYNIGSDGGEKCRQKFQNLLKIYVKYRDHTKATGSERKDPPKYYELMHSIMGGKHKVAPGYLQDSLEKVCDTEEGDTSNCDESDVASSSTHRSDIRNRYGKSQAKTRPKSQNEKLLDFLKAESAELRQERNRQFSLLEKLVNTHSEQQEKLINVLKRKRKEKEESSDSD